MASLFGGTARIVRFAPFSAAPDRFSRVLITPPPGSQSFAWRTMLRPTQGAGFDLIATGRFWLIGDIRRRFRAEPV